MNVCTLLLVSAMFGATTVGAQSVGEHIIAGDSAYAQRRPEEALRHFEAALAVDSTKYEALWKASRSEVDLGEAAQDGAQKAKYFKAGETYARRAVAVYPNDAEGHFSLARAVGRRALSVGVRERVKLGTEVRTQALEALKYDPKHAGALHVMGVWNAEVMRLNGFERFFAKNVLGGAVFGSANWKDAVSYMEKAVEVDPDRLSHHLDLGKIYLDVGDKAKARAQFQLVVDGRATEVPDPLYRREAADLLKQLDKK
jgi:tetratricopeptide (TPR) repeat protein